jgi:Tol biopolymer transport system component
MNDPMSEMNLKSKRKNDDPRKGYRMRWLAGAFLGFLLLTGIGLYIALRPDPILFPQYPAASLVYTTETDKRRFSINLQTRKFGYLNEAAPDYRAPRLSPDGKWRVLWQVTGIENESDLVLENASADKPPRILGRFFHAVASPTWSADNQWLAFSAASEKVNPASMSWMVQELWIMKIETGELKRLTENNGVQEVSPSFSPDGTHLAYVSNACGSFCLFIMDLAAGESEMILYDTEHMVGDPSWWPSTHHPAWSPDGQWIAVVSHDPNDKYLVWITRPDGSEAHIVGGSGPYAANPEWRLE